MEDQSSPQETYSPGLEGIIAGETAISTLVGGLQYRGYAVEVLAQHASFEEVAYLLLYGVLPTANQLHEFRGRLGAAAAIEPRILEILREIPAAAPAMDVMRTGASLLAHWDPDISISDRPARLRQAERLLARLPVIMAARQRLLASKEPVPPDPGRSLAANILWMLSRREPTPQATRSLEVSLILYAEHEYNASTFTARTISSTLSDMYSAIVGAIGALKGPLHGGANERVLEVLEEIGTPDRAEAWVRQALGEKRKIMGFGHRVYKSGDPRATYLRTLCATLAAETGHENMEKIADVVERIVRTEKKLPPNLDWPSARLYHYLGLPVGLYTPLFVVSRVVGWSAHVIEQLDNNRLIRPRSRYTGPQSRPWVALADR